MPVIYLAVLLLVFGLALAVLASGEARGAVPQGKTMAELTMDEKNRLSHRAKAVLNAKGILKEYLQT